MVMGFFETKDLYLFNRHLLGNFYVSDTELGNLWEKQDTVFFSRTYSLVGMKDIDQERQLRSFELDPWSSLRWDTGENMTSPVGVFMEEMGKMDHGKR